ncbi:MAG: hypothetical protein HQK77_06280 [Desulfobacterales bacterium]|nr:hypothetical protein [Desulfobacterales bacterium]
MRRRYSNQTTPISLFSFQDIITSLVGILILITLLLGIEVTAKTDLTISLGKNKPNPVENEQNEKINAKQALEQKLNQLQSEFEEISNGKLQENLTEKEMLKQKLSQLQNKLLELNKNKKMAIIPGKDTKLPLIIECSQKGIVFSSIGQKEHPYTFTPNSQGIYDLMEHVRNRKKALDYFVVMIKPSGSDYALFIVDKIKAQGFDVGYDALEEDVSLSYGDE